ncbi:MAG: enoyl-CoA hydratase/isomerase family protein [Actinobacteria bacterium]|nr:enoyl-CoA hydratase/isomerase family protein [Actinomycetota bacterium]
MLATYHPDILVESDQHVTTVTINRPEAKNSCTGDMWVALGRTFQDLGQAGVRAVVLTGAGGEFCAGADLTGGAGAQAFPPRGTMLDYMRVLGDVVLAVHGCPVPVVAKVDGACVGAGLGLALAADMIWCSDRARFSAIFAKRGLSLDFGTSWLLRQRIGVHKAKELAFTAKMVSGSEALALGLVNAKVPAGELDAAVRSVVETITAGPPMALATTKRELDNAATSSFAQALEVEALGQSLNAQSDDLGEALTAYAEGRPPVFRGR